jgi:hypothetical protein
VGKNLPTSRAERVNVHVEELDGVDEITITENVDLQRPEADGHPQDAGLDAPRR